MIESPVSYPLRKWTQTEVHLKWFDENWRKYIRPGRVLLKVKWGNMSIMERLITLSVSSFFSTLSPWSWWCCVETMSRRKNQVTSFSISWQDPREKNAHTISIYSIYWLFLSIILYFGYTKSNFGSHKKKWFFWKYFFPFFSKWLL